MSLKEWLAKYFYVRLSPKPVTWPKTEKVTVMTLAPLELGSTKVIDRRDTVGAGTKLPLVRIPNPHGFSEPWIKLEWFNLGAAENYWLDALKSGKIKILSIDQE